MPEMPPETYVVLGLDIIKYSEKSLLEQKLAQERIDHCFNQALLQTKPDGTSMPHWIDAGDGGYALFKWADLNVLEFLKDFYRRLSRQNTNITDDKRKVLIRAALHKDEVVVWDTAIAEKPIRKYTGHAINNCARLMSGMIKDHTSQVICSRPVLDSIMRMDRNVSPTRLKDIEDKHGHKHEVWNVRIDPLLGVDPLQKELYIDPLLRIYPGPSK